jgi:Putative zinc-finger
MTRRPESHNTHCTAPVCEEVCTLLSAVVDGRATPAETAFTNTHLARCSSCASYLAFLNAEKTAWVRSSMVVPPSGLSARIAAATYRKPTFAGRFAGFLAVFFPIPARVAVGVAAVTGVAFLVVPRAPVSAPVAQVIPVPTSNSVHASGEHAGPVADRVPQVSVTASVSKPVSVKPESELIKPKPATAKPELEAPVADTIGVPVASEPTAKRAIANNVPQRVATQVAIVRPRHDVNSGAGRSVDAGHTLPAMNGGAAETNVAEAPVKPVDSLKPDVKEPAATAPATVTVAVANEPDAESNDGFLHLGRKLHNVDRMAEGELSGAGVRLAMVAQSGGNIVSAPVK